MVADPGHLDELVATLSSVDRYGLDTEFHRERTYWPRLALLQVAWEGSAGRTEVALVDPLAVDVSPLGQVLEGPGVLVAHAADQDLEVLEQACGTVPGRLLDTQVAAGFLGHGSASLASLLSSFLGLRLPKADRLTDWNRRPLTEAQCGYAAADVANLLELTDVLTARLEKEGRLAWVEEECAGLLARARGPQDPDQVWWRLRDARALRGAARGVAQELAAWRELRARQQDLPPRFVLPDLALQAMVHAQPRTVTDLEQVRGMDGRKLKGPQAAEILAAIERGRQLDPERLRLPPADDVDRDMRPAVALAAAWVGQLARDEHIEAALLATRGDLVAFLRDEPGSRLGSGWRETLVGGRVRRLLGGEAALAFDGGGRLVLEARSRRPLAGDGASGSGRDQDDSRVGGDPA